MYFSDFVKMSITCSICQEYINFCDEEISVLRCGHLYHQQCLQQWLDTDFSCPECRAEVTRNNYIKKIYPSVIDDEDYRKQKTRVYKGSADETKSILKVFYENNANFEKLFLKRIANLENLNDNLAENISRLEENRSITSTTIRSLQKENKDKVEETNTLIHDNKKLIGDIITLRKKLKKMSQEKTFREQEESALRSLESENSRLKNKLSLVLDVLLSEECSTDDQSTNTS